MLLMCVPYVCFGSKVMPRAFRYIAMGSAVLFILRYRLLLYSAGCGVNREQVDLPGFSRDWFVLPGQKLYVGMVVCSS